MFGGFQKSSFIEYPDKISAVVFTLGCNFRCPFCQNYRLVIPEKYPVERYKEEDILTYLKKRKNVLDALSITGGEPTIHGSALINFMRKVKQIGLLVQLETNGTNPGVIKRALSEELVDYIAMDIKAPPGKYPLLTGRKEVDLTSITKSIELIINRAPEYEFRTTFAPMLTVEDFKAIGEMIRGAKKYVIQKFESRDVLNLKIRKFGIPTKKDAEQAATITRKLVYEVIVRGFND